MTSVDAAPVLRLAGLGAAAAAGFAWAALHGAALFADALVPGGVAQPPWGSLAALAGAAAGSYGTALYALRGRDARWRSLGWLALAAFLAARVWLFGGVTWAGAGAPRSMVWAASPALQAMVGWWAGERLARFALGPLAGAGWTAAYERTRAELLRFILVLAGSWAAASLIAPQVDEAPGVAPALLGAALLLLAGALLAATLHACAVQERLAEEGARLEPSLRGGVPRSLGWLVAAIAALALFVPANLSPLHLRDFNRWMQALTDNVVGPLLVPSQSPGRIIGEEVRRISVDAALAGLARRGSSNPLEDLMNLGARVVVLVAVLWIGWRIFGTVRRAHPGGSGPGRLSWGFGWLYEQVRDWVVILLRRLGFALRGRGAEGRGRTSPAPAPARRGRQRPVLDSVIAVYCYALERLAGRGFPRAGSETPYEYLRRWQEEGPGARRGRGSDGGALAELTELYVEVRYREREPGPGALETARRAASRLLRGVRRAALAAAILGRTGRR